MDRAEINKLIVMLGSLETPDDVAEFLRANNIRGRKHDPMLCPIANLFRVKVGGVPSVGVWSVSYPASRTPYRDRYDLPKPVSAFISAFDHNHVYQDLKEDA